MRVRRRLASTAMEAADVLYSSTCLCALGSWIVQIML